MKKLVLMTALALGLAACDTAEQTIAAGAATGAVLGGEDNLIEGALIGAAAGATYEYLRRDRDDDDRCYYRNIDTGQLVVAECVT